MSVDKKMERIQNAVQSEMDRWFKRGNIGQVLIDREATGRTLSPGDLDRWLNETTAPFYTDQACDLVSMSQRPSLGLRIVSIEAESIVPKCALLERERERERERLAVGYIQRGIRDTCSYCSALR